MTTAGRDGMTGFSEVVLSWPERRNALGPAEANVLREALTRAADDQFCRVIVLHAEGKVFCAGGDLRAVLDMVDQGEQALRAGLYDAFQGLLRTVRTSPVPIIAAVDGPAIGLGLDLALACQARVLGSKAWVSQGWAQLGLISAPGGIWDQSRLASALTWRLASSGRLSAAELAPLTGDELCEAPLERAREMAAVKAPAGGSQCGCERMYTARATGGLLPVCCCVRGGPTAPR